MTIFGLGDGMLSARKSWGREKQVSKKTDRQMNNKQANKNRQTNKQTSKKITESTDKHIKRIKK